jgi:hypothetical protein
VIGRNENKILIERKSRNTLFYKLLIHWLGFDILPAGFFRLHVTPLTATTNKASYELTTLSCDRQTKVQTDESTDRQTKVQAESTCSEDPNLISDASIFLILLV